MKKLLLALILLPVFSAAVEPSPTTQQEVAHLIGYLKNSGCEFNRNGSWYSSGEAADHLNQKYQYLLKKGLAVSAEEFISRVASESSTSGKPYQVRCGASALVPSGPWLQAELVKYRAAGR
jgi:Family of unknown function (DUF5329)